MVQIMIYYYGKFSLTCNALITGCSSRYKNMYIQQNTNNIMFF